MMVLRKKLVLLSLILAAFLSGCGKKAEKADKTVALADMESVQTFASAENPEEIPVLKEEVEDFFEDDESISKFAFVDDNEFAEKKEGVDDFFENDGLGKDSAEVAFADENTMQESEEDSFVSWENEEEAEASSFGMVHFDINKNEVREDQKEIIKKNVQVAKEAVKKGKKVVVLGHCCQLGSPSYNIPLSERRAKVIKDEMLKNGVPEESIKTVGMGQEMPLIWSDSTDRKTKIQGLAANRRAEISIG